MRILLLEFMLAGAVVFAQTATESMNPRQLLQNAVEHQWNDDNRADQFTHIELWQNLNFGEHSEPLVDESAKFDTIVINGKPYLRMIEQNGNPLSHDDADAEGRSYNSAIAAGNGLTMQDRVSSLASKNLGLHLHLDLLPEYFHSTVLGTDVVNGRTAILLQCNPRRDAKPKGKEAAKGMQFRIRVWVDERDHAFARVEAELLRNRDGMLSGTTAALTWAPIDGVWLPTRMSIHGQAKLGKEIETLDTEFIYSDYKRFRTSLRILNSWQPVDGNGPPSRGSMRSPSMPVPKD